MNKLLQTTIRLAACIAVTAAFAQCGGKSSEQQGPELDEYGGYWENDSTYVVEAVEDYDAEYVDWDTTMMAIMDSVYDPYYTVDYEDVSVETYEQTPAAEPVRSKVKEPAQAKVKESTKKQSTSELRNKFHDRTEELYNIWEGRLNDYNIAMVFYDKEENDLYIIVTDPDKSSRSKEELRSIAKDCATLTRQTLYQDIFGGPGSSDEATLLYEVNPTIYVSIADFMSKGDKFKFSLKETLE